MADAPKYPDFSQPSIMNPKYGPAVAKMLGPLIREMQRQQQFAGAFGVSPRQAIKPTPEETQRMLNVGLAFGGADITKEQREAWEAENKAYREGRSSDAPRKHPPYEPGTRVYIRPSESFARVRDPFHKYPGDEGNFNAIVIDPSKNPLADKLGWDPIKAEKQSMTPPSPDHVAVQFEDKRFGGRPGYSYWFWKHRNDLEVLPPKEDEWAVGTEVLYPGTGRHEALSGTVGEPPKSRPNPGRPKENFVWIDYPSSPDEPPRGGWFHKKDLQRKK